jgi:hypothetical protein
MTEAEWMACEDPTVLMSQDSLSDRKRRLFVVACCRRLWDHLPTFHRSALETAERYADGEACEDDLSDFLEQAHHRFMFFEDGGPDWRAAEAWRLNNAVDHAIQAALDLPNWQCHLCGEEMRVMNAAGWGGAVLGCEQCPNTYRWSLVRAPEFVRASRQMRDNAHSEATLQATLLRDIFGNPFRPATFDSAWRTSTAVAIARGMYESRDFGTMPILADAIQDAGCDSDDILNHCRGDGPHVRGCWVVDLVLGKT